MVTDGDSSSGGRAALALHFSGDELVGSAFWNPALGRKLVNVRGKVPGALQADGTFCWTAGVQALSVLLLKHILSKKIAAHGRPHSPLLSGGRGSRAASLDFAISKQSLWLQDFFGVDKAGRMYARRIILRSNPERKLPGPVVLGINAKILPAENVAIYRDEREITAHTEIQNLLFGLDGDRDETQNDQLELSVDSITRNWILPNRLSVAGA